MKVPLRLALRPKADPPVAALFPVNRADIAIEACARRGLSPWGKTFATADGLLVKFGCRVVGPIPGAIRLRAIAEDLLIPIDADLLPALLDDELRGLTRDRGLVFLPGGRFLAYDPSSPVDPARLLSTNSRREGGWSAFPDPDPLGDRIESIELAFEDPFQTLALAPTSDGEGETAPGSPADQAIGRASLGLGRGLIWLGKTLGIRPIAEQGARWVKQAIEQAPHLSEAVLGRQSAAIQALLKEFREGDPERALGKAMPIGDDRPGRGSSPSIADRLADQDTRYSLASLLGGGGGGGSGYWMGADDLVAALAREYRRAAEAALKAGDFRRAAYIFGKLLHDFRSAANALRSGGLHRDAAMVFLNRLDDRRSAARAFEAAGDFDRALGLYRDLNEHVAAAELLRRIGEEDEAIRHFQLAARELAERPGGRLAAGNLLLDRAGRDDLALEQFAEGWKQRPSPGDLSCALRLLQLRSVRAEHREFLGTLDEASGFLAGPGAGPEASRFFNQIMGLSHDLPPEVADEVRDRARLGLAGELRARLADGQRAGSMVSTLFGQQPHWGRGLVADADLAARHEAGRATRPRPPSATGPFVQVGSGLVTALASSPESGDLFLGFDNGDLFAFHSESGEAIRIAGGSHPIATLSADPAGTVVVAVQAGRSHSGRARRGRIDAYERGRDGLYQAMAGFAVDDLADPWLTPISRRNLGSLVGLWDGQALYFLALPGLSERGALMGRADRQNGPTAGLLLPGTPDHPGPAILWHDGRGWAVASHDEGEIRSADGVVAEDPCRPRIPSNSPLRSAWSDGLWIGRSVLQIVWGGEDGEIRWRRIDLRDREIAQPQRRLTTDDGGYRHASLIRSGLVAGLAAGRVEWIKIGPLGSRVLQCTPIDRIHPIACRVGRLGRTLLVVGAGGEVVRLPIPPV